MIEKFFIGFLFLSFSAWSQVVTYDTIVEIKENQTGSGPPAATVPRWPVPGRSGPRAPDGHYPTAPATGLSGDAAGWVGCHTGCTG